MTEAELEKRIDDLYRKMRQTEKEFEAAKSELAALKCPFVVGDSITYRYGQIRRKAVVEAVQAWSSSYKLIVRNVLASGSFGGVCTIYSYLGIEKEPK